MEEVRTELEVSRGRETAAAERETANQEHLQAMEATHEQEVAAVKQRVAKARFDMLWAVRICNAAVIYRIQDVLAGSACFDV